MSIVPVLSENADAAEVRSKLIEAGDNWKQIRSKSHDQLTDEDRSSIRGLASFINEADVVDKVFTRFSEEEDRRNTRDLQSRGPRVANDVPRERQKGVFERFTDLEDFQKFAKSGQASDEFLARTIEGSFHQRGLISEGDPLTDAWGDLVQGAGTLVPQMPPIVVPPRQRRLFIRDLISAVTTDRSAIPYVQEINVSVNETGASAVAEGVAKPEVDIEFIERLSPVKKIAAWVPITTEIIEDAPMLRAYINTRLTYMIKLREEVQIISGPGTGPNLLGIINQVDNNGDPAIQTQSNVGTNDLPATVAAAMGKLENVDADVDAIAVHPITYWAAVGSRHAASFDGGTGTAGAPGITPDILWGLPPLRTRGLSTGQFLLGAYRMAAQIWDRTDVTIRVGNQHGEYFVQNKLVVLGEERLTLIVPKPEWFCLGSVTVAGG